MDSGSNKKESWSLTPRGSVSSQTLAPHFAVVGLNKKSNFYVIDYLNRVVLRVHKQEFKSREGLVITHGKCLFKVISGTRAQAREIIVKNTWQAEGLFSVVKNLVSVSKTTAGYFSQAITLMRDDKTVPPILLDMFSLYISAITPTYSNWTPTYLVGFFARIASLVMRVRDLPFQAESFDGLLLATLAMGMPPTAVDILKKMSLLTSKKLFDTPNFLFEFFSQISQLLLLLFDYVPGVPVCVRRRVQQVLSLGYKYERFGHMKSKVELWQRDKRVMIEPQFRKEVRDLFKEVNEDEILLDYVKSGPAPIRSRWDTFVRLHKSVDSYESCSRKEPVCIVLEGPPGCRKTVASVKVSEVLGLSTYVHTVKSVDDGKDFYDGYNNEEVFVMDDVGQQGVSQWRTIINMVSSLKLPLECASVDLKDTKYFNSEVMLLTTNQFTDLTFLRSDCISDKEALFRRGHVFKYTDHSCTYYRYDMKEHRFVSQYPPGLAKKLPLSLYFDDGYDNAVPRITVWLTAWIKILKEYYQSIYTSITCSEIQKQQLRLEVANMLDNCQEEFHDAWQSQNWGDLLTSCVEACSDAADFVSYYVGKLLGYFSSWVVEVGDLASKVPNWVVYFSASAALAAGLMYIRSLWGRVEDEDMSMVDMWRKSMTVKSHKIKITPSTVLIAEENTSTMLDAIKRHMGVIRLYRDNGVQPMTQCLISGHYVIIPAHMLFKVRQECTIYSSYDAVTNDWRALDMVPFTVEIMEEEKDIAVLSLPKDMLTPFKKASQYFKVNNGKTAKLHLVTCDAVVDLGASASVHPTAIRYRQPQTGLEREIYRTIENPVVYGISCPGLCGALLVDPDIGIVGMHLSGNGEYGASRVFSQSLIDKIRTCLERDKNLLDVNVLGVEGSFSGIKCKTDYYHQPQKKTHIVPSPLAGLKEPTKFPPNLSANGDKTVVVRASRFYVPQGSVISEELEFGEKFLSVIIPSFGSLPDYEVIKGNANLPSLNKKSVNGYFFPGDKEEYLDYENGCMRPEFEKRMLEFRARILEGRVKLEDVMMYEALKDETRVPEKVNKPRSFTIDNLLAQYEMKRLMGRLFEGVVFEKWKNQIMIGLNPFSEWPRVHKEISKCELKWDADLGEWDAKQLAQVQDLVNKVVLSKFVGSDEDKSILSFLLENSVRSWVLVLNTLFLGTHGMKSGKWITALFNSIYNRVYTAIWYYWMCVRNKKRPSVGHFLNNVVDFVMGDDKLCGVSKELANLEFPLDSHSMKEFFESIGMTYTDGSKSKDITNKSVDELTFLKRGFRFHTELGIVAPLSKETLDNTLLWVDSTKDLEEVMSGKLDAVQRELYLHEDEDTVLKIEEFCREKGVEFVRFPKSYLYYLFKCEPDYVYKLYVQGKGIEGVI